MNLTCPFNTTFITNTPAYNTTCQYVGQAAEYAGLARDAVINFANESAPVVSSTLSAFAKTINESPIAATLATYGATPAIAGTVFCGAVGGGLLQKRPVLALTTIAAGCLLTSNKTELAYLAASTVTMAVAGGLARTVGLIK